MTFEHTFEGGKGIGHIDTGVEVGEAVAGDRHGPCPGSKSEVSLHP